MKIIDEKGRLFGKINVIDFLVILFLISLTPMFYYGYKIFNTPPPPPPLPPPPLQDYQTSINVFVLFKNIPENIAKKIAINDKEVDEEGRIIGQILSIVKIEPNTLIAGGNTIVDNTRKQVIAKMLINVNVSTNSQMSYKGEAISENKAITFRTGKYTIVGIIVSYPTEERGVKVKFNGLIPEIVSLINKGDYEGIIKAQDEGQKKDIKLEFKEGITAIVKDDPIVESRKAISFYEFYEHGEYKSLPYPSNQKDVTLSLEILCIKKDDGLLYYKDRPVKVGASFSFQTKEYDINGTIIGVEKQK